MGTLVSKKTRCDIFLLLCLVQDKNQIYMKEKIGKLMTQTPLESSDVVSPRQSEGERALPSLLVWPPCPNALPAHQLQIATALQGENQCHAVTALASHPKT